MQVYIYTHGCPHTNTLYIFAWWAHKEGTTELRIQEEEFTLRSESRAPLLSGEISLDSGAVYIWNASLWWYTFNHGLLERARQRYFGAFHGSLVYIVSSKPASATQEDPVSTYKMKHRKFPHSLMCLGPWSPAGNLLGKPVEPLGGGALLEEPGRWERPELYSPRPLFVLPLSLQVWIQCE